MRSVFYPAVLRSSIAALLILVGVINANATHLRAGNIIVEKIGDDCSIRVYRITVRVYTKYNPNAQTVLFGGEGDILDFGDGTRIEVPIQDNIPIDPEFGIAYAEYTIDHPYAGPGQYMISYSEKNRNENVLNMTGSVNTPFYLETVIRIDPAFGCSTPAKLLVDPIDFACSGVAWTHNPGAYDPDGDSISYEMVVPKQTRSQNVNDYRSPEVFSTANEDGGAPYFSIDPRTGTITWDTPGTIGEFNIAFNIVEWRLDTANNVWNRMGHIRRDMQIIVLDCENNRPELDIPNDTCIVAGTTLNATIYGYDLLPDPPAPQVLDDVKIQAFSEILNNPPTPSPVATVAPSNVFLPSVPKAEMQFQWNTICEHIRRQPYQVVFKVTDRRVGEASLATFKTWMIKVVAPAPEWDNVVVDDDRIATVTWDPYTCANAQRMEVWRRVDSVSFTPDNCETGMPGYLGYKKLAEVSLGTGQDYYVDTNEGKGLSPGAVYCYRLVAKFRLPKGGESYVSKDICTEAIKSDVPIITNVSVQKTSTTIGEIKVVWRRPFEASAVDFPPPIHYEVYRGSGFVRSDSVLVATLPTVNDTTFIDTGINTEENIYNYSVTAYASNGNFGNSIPASSVRLETRSLVGKIELNWDAIVPWSNLLQSTPGKNFTHEIYRGPEGSTEGTLVKIADIDPTVEGMVYTDEGLADNTTYCYRILTRGSYGNPYIIEPLENFSQMVCVQTGDEEPPCTPELFVVLNDCKDYTTLLSTCEGSSITNTIYWNRPEDPVCRADIRGYNIYRSNASGGTFTLIKELELDTVFHDENLPSFAWCYKILAVDRSGNESDFSNVVCNDNCPYYELPNAFSPNGDFHNDKFSAYSNLNRGCSENDPCPPIPEENQIKCARFVEKVKFKVFNRWGQEVYSYQSGSSSEDGSDADKSIYIDWNGRDSNGTALAPAVYFYVAEVTFDVLRPEDKVRVYKGWVHLLDDPK